MRSLRALTWLLVLLVLVPAGVLAWLGYRSADALDDAVDAGIRADLTEAAQRIEAACTEERLALEARVTDHLEHLAETLGREAPRDGLPAAMAALRARLPTEVTVWEVRLVDPDGTMLWPRTLPPDEPASSRLTDRLLHDLRRQADRLRFGEGDPDAALRVWRDAAEQARAKRVRAVALAEAALLEVRLGRVDPSEAHAALLARFDDEESRAAARPLTLLLVWGAVRKDREAACVLADAWLAGDLAAVPLRQAERWAAMRVVSVCQEARTVTMPPPGLGSPLLASIEASGAGAVEAGGVLATPPQVAVDGPGGSRLVATLDPSSVWAAMEVPLESRAWDPVHVHVARFATPGPDVEGDGWLPALHPSGAFGVPGTVWYTHTASAEAREARTIRRRVTQIGVVSLLVLMGVGLLVVRRAVRRERDARRLRDDFIANVSHELRTPLTSVCLNAEMLADEDPPADRRRELARVVKAEGGRLAALVDDLLDFAALEQGVRRIEPEPVDLARAVREAAAPYETLAAREGVELEVDVPEGELVALADAHALSRVLANLLSNAWRHGRPSRDGAPGRLRIRAYDDPETEEGPTVEVQDDGPGIPAEERGTIFERFHRGRASKRVEGTGLGLALGRELARAMDGELVLVPEPLATVFRLTLPALPDLEV